MFPQPPKPTTECVYSILSTVAAALLSTGAARLPLGLHRFPPYAVQQGLVTTVTLGLATAAAAAAPSGFTAAPAAPWRLLRRAAVALRPAGAAAAAARQQLPAAAPGAPHYHHQHKLQPSAVQACSDLPEPGAAWAVPLSACGSGDTRAPTTFSPYIESVIGVNYGSATHGSSCAGETQTQRAAPTGGNAAGDGSTDGSCSCGRGGCSSMSVISSSSAGATDSSAAGCHVPCSREGSSCPILRLAWLQQQQQHRRDQLRQRADEESGASPGGPGGRDPASTVAGVGSGRQHKHSGRSGSSTDGGGAGGGSCAATEVTAQEIIASFACAMGVRSSAPAPQPLPPPLPPYRSRSKLRRLLLRPPSFPPGRSARVAAMDRSPSGMAAAAAERGCISESSLPGSAPPKELLQRWDFGPDYFAGLDLTE